MPGVELGGKALEWHVQKPGSVPGAEKKKIFLINILSRGLECSSVVEHLPSKNKTLGSLMPQGEKIRKKMTDLSLTSRH